MDFDHLYKLASIYKKAISYPKEGDKITAEVLSVISSGGSKIITIKLGEELDGAHRKLFFIEDEDE